MPLDLPAERVLSFLTGPLDETHGGSPSPQYLATPIEYGLIKPAWNTIRKAANQDIDSVASEFRHLTFMSFKV